jgi:hypothetical protein
VAALPAAVSDAVLMVIVFLAYGRSDDRGVGSRSSSGEALCAATGSGVLRRIVVIRNGGQQTWQESLQLPE